MNIRNRFFAQQIENDDTLTYGRVVVDYGTQYVVNINEIMVKGTVSGKFRNECDQMPVIGDYVGVSLHNSQEDCIIHRLLSRKTEFARKAAGNRTDKQVQGANFDTVFIVMALNNDFNVRKLERFVLAAWDTGAVPVVVLSKADLCEDIEGRLNEVADVTPGVSVHVISALMDQGLEPIRGHLKDDATIALFGASGVGKSTLINRLVGREVMNVNTVRGGDEQGRHTTTHREMISLDDGVNLIDTPGMRELGIWDDGSGVDRTFSEVTSLTKQCRFSDCGHTNEPGCAIREALSSGDLDGARYESYLKLKKEAAYIERKNDQKLKLEEKKKWRDFNVQFRKSQKNRF